MQYNKTSFEKISQELEQSVRAQRDLINHYFRTHNSRTQPQWVFAGEALTLEAFAQRIWPTDCEERMLFILTHSGTEREY